MRDESVTQSLLRLADLETEYDCTVRVLSVLVERVQHLTGSQEVQISDFAVADQPDLTAWRNASDGYISLHTAR